MSAVVRGLPEQPDQAVETTAVPFDQRYGFLSRKNCLETPILGVHTWKPPLLREYGPMTVAQASDDPSPEFASRLNPAKSLAQESTAALDSRRKLNCGPMAGRPI